MLYQAYLYINVHKREPVPISTKMVFDVSKKGKDFDHSLDTTFFTKYELVDGWETIIKAKNRKADWISLETIYNDYVIDHQTSFVNFRTKVKAILTKRPSPDARIVVDGRKLTYIPYRKIKINV